MNEKQPPTPPKPPTKWRMSIVVWLAIYPLITLVLWIFGSKLAQIKPLALRTFVITIVVVPIMVYWALPLVQKYLGNWLRK